FRERDAEIRRARRIPIRDQLAQAIQYQGAKARIVLRQIVDAGSRRYGRRARVLRSAVEGCGAFDLEAELDGAEARVEPGGRTVITVERGGDQAQRVDGVIAVAAGCHRQDEVGVGQLGEIARRGAGDRRGRRIRGGRRPAHLDVLNPGAALDDDVVDGESPHREQQMDEEGPLACQTREGFVVEHLEIVDAVDERRAGAGVVGTDQIASQRVAALVHHWPPPEVKVCTCRTWVWRTTYCTVTLSVESTALTLTDSSAMRLPSQLCNAPCTRNCTAAAAESLLGANTCCSTPLPKLGRLIRSPGAVKSTCSMRPLM